MPTKSSALTQKKRKIYLFLALVVLLTSALVVKKFYLRDSPYQKQLQLLSEEINKTCPTLVDPQTRLDNTEISGPNAFQYNFTLLNLEKGNFDEADLKKFLSGQILESITNSEGMRIFKEQGTKLSYQYRDKNNEELFVLSFDEDDYR